MRNHLKAIVLSCLLTIFISNYTEAPFSVFIARIRLKLIMSDSGIPSYDYGGITGRQMNPVSVAQMAVKYYTRLENIRGKTQKEFLNSNDWLAYYEVKENNPDVLKNKFMNCANWLAANAVSRGDYSLLEYKFPYPELNISSPWRSAMAQGQALHVLIRAHKLTGDNKYLIAAKRLLNTFFVEVKGGGVTYKTNDKGWWYEECANNNGIRPRILNGMMYAMLGVYDYYKYTGDPDAGYIFDQGILGLENNLANYDQGGYSYYDALKEDGGRYYHITHIKLLQILYDITGKSIFKKYHDRWSNYNSSWFIYKLITHPSRQGLVILAANFLLSLGISYFFIYCGRLFYLKR